MKSTFALLVLHLAGQVFCTPGPGGGMQNSYDFIIVGGGTAGLVLANRLTEDNHTSVLVIEAGNTDLGNLDIEVPFFCAQATPFTSVDWNFTTVPQTNLNGRSLAYPRGFVLGGSSSVNFLAYTRGSEDDWDRFASVTGDQGWSWNQILPFFLRSEKLTPPADGHNTTGEIIPSDHGTSGLVGDSLPGFPTPLDPMVLATTTEDPEFPFNPDVNSGSPLGISWALSTIAAGVRSSSATSYFRPFSTRPNLDLLLNTQVTRVLPSNSGSSTPQFQMVEVAQSSNGPRTQIQANKEIILSAGAVKTPQILLLSGIGPAETLNTMGIPIVLDSPSVGQNLTDQPIVAQSWSVTGNDTFETVERDPAIAAEEFAEWNSTRTGPLTDTLLNQFGWLRVENLTSLFSDPASGPNAPHFELLFINGLILTAVPPTGNFLTISSADVSPTSRGTITLQSSDPFDAPLIDPNFLATDVDFFVMREAMRSAQKFVSNAAWSNYIIAPSFNGTTDDELDAFIRENTIPIFHPVGSAAMSAQNADHGVVDPDLTLKGAKGLRIVDASVFPFIPAAHPQAGVYALAERASDLIKAAWGLS
ncbi:aryl-alcohol-oxidase from pleurotus Eryingii [Pluteus cervinus]|uniref:Aryl-alcohol-oxidase from pleurotus Eryingii n=1 Tax=Pluteus cervinus TaxID=181527 RepID=A0ACD3A659_9AGAR|nr:aryl-alcohol-oxidase from pleurotus Eryingii [Pluteus cervinus]